MKPRDRFTGGGNKVTEQTTGSIKALDPVTGETKAVARTDLPNWSGVLATGGNLVFTGLWEGRLVAYDGKIMQELWRFDTGCGVMAPPISYAVNGKQYIAVAVGPKWLGHQRPAALKYANACSMVYVFTLCRRRSPLPWVTSHILKPGTSPRARLSCSHRTGYGAPLPRAGRGRLALRSG